MSRNERSPGAGLSRGGITRLYINHLPSPLTDSASEGKTPYDRALVGVRRFISTIEGLEPTIDPSSRKKIYSREDVIIIVRQILTVLSTHPSVNQASGLKPLIELGIDHEVARKVYESLVNIDE